MAQLILHVRRTTNVLWLLCGLVAACGHDDGPAVPFKFGEPDQPTVAPTEAPPTPVIDPSHDLRSDGLAITSNAQGVIVLTRAMPGAGNVTQVAQLHTLAKGCSVNADGTQLNPLSPSYNFATVDIACAVDSKVPAVAAPLPQITRLHWLLSTDETPRVLERFTLLPGPPGAASVNALRLNPRAEDVDGDQNADVIVTLNCSEQHPTEHVVTLRWMNRVGGLDRDRSEPEASFTAMFTAAQVLRSSQAAYATALREIVTCHDLLCAESGHPRLAIGGHTGIVCGRSKAVGKAWAAITREAVAHAGDSAESLLAALDALEKLADPAMTVDAAERTNAEQALKRIAAATHWQWQPGPSIVEVRAPETRLPMVGFVDGHTLLLRGATQQNYDLVTGTLTTINAAPADLLMRDPSGSLAVIGIERQCDGYRLKIVRAEQIVGGIVLGASTAEALVETRSAPSNARCDQPNPTYRGPNDGRWNVLGWAPSTIVLASGHAVHTLAVDAMAHAAGATSPATFPVATPVAAGAIAPDGSAHALLTSVGILVTAANGSVHLIEPLGPVSARDVAVAPNGAGLAYVFGGRVFIGTPPGTATAPIPPVATPLTP